jgi:hypothetical protein
MLFWLINALVSFYIMIINILRIFINKFVIVYLNNILIYSETIEEYKEHVKQVFTAL